MRSRRAALRVMLPMAVALSATVMGVSAASGPPPSAAPGAQLLGVHPRLQGVTTLAGGHFNYSVAPGSAVSDAMVIENFSDRALAVRVYGADVQTAAGGGLAPAQAEATMRQVGAWIRVSQPSLTIPPHRPATDPFTVSPPDSLEPGEYVGA